MRCNAIQCKNPIQSQNWKNDLRHAGVPALSTQFADEVKNNDHKDDAAADDHDGDEDDHDAADDDHDGDGDDETSF